jgi:predicted DNA-binding ribbon-helix-helix protein
LGFHATQAARAFRLKGYTQKPFILNHLSDYYSIISTQSSSSLDPYKCAELEYDWWQMRREKRSASDIAMTIASLLSEIYQTPKESLLPCSSLRVEMMRFRDERRNQAIQPNEWAFIQSGLNESYRSLHEKINP